MSKTVLFHCALPIKDANGDIVVKENGKVAKDVPTHTLAFTSLGGNTIAMAWAVAHSELDNYNRKIGRQIAEGRLSVLCDEVMGDVSENTTSVDSVDTDILPNIVIQDNFDYYLESAINVLVDTPEDGVELVFRAVDGEVCSIEVDIDAEDEVDEDLSDEKTDDGTSDYIFACFVNEDDEIVVYVQNREGFAEIEAVNEVVTPEMATILGPVMNEHGFLIVDEQKPILVHEELSEIEVVRILKGAGLSYSNELEEVLLG